jgi:hypothetical protein
MIPLRRRTGSTGLVLDAEDRVVSRFELPSPPDGGTWTYGGWRTPPDRVLMTAGDRAAYVLLHSVEPPTTMIATISQSGEVNLKTLEPISDDPQDTSWLVGPGVAVEKYTLINGKGSVIGGHPVSHFDEYDLKSGKKNASKTARMGEFTPFAVACYYGDSVTGLGSHAPIVADEPYLRLRIAKLQ